MESPYFPSAKAWSSKAKLLATRQRSTPRCRHARASSEIRCLRDPTRGGVSSSFNEIAARSRVGIELEESAIPIREEVRGACEMLGLDPLYVANEGKLVAIAVPVDADRILEAMRRIRSAATQDHRHRH